MISWPVGEFPEFKFGCRVSAHIVEIDATPGDIVHYGQKDKRGNGTRKEWGIVQYDGSIENISSKRARELWLERASV